MPALKTHLICSLLLELHGYELPHLLIVGLVLGSVQMKAVCSQIMRLVLKRQLTHTVKCSLAIQGPYVMVYIVSYPLRKCPR